MRTLVIGGTGFTGRRVLALRPGDAEVYGTFRSEAGRRCLEADGVVPVAGDLDDPNSIGLVLKDVEPSHVIVVASLGFGHAADLVESLEAGGGPRTVFTSTTGIFTRLNPASKSIRLDAERAIVESSLPFTIVRPTMIYGRPGDRNMERLLRWLRRVPVVPAPGGGLNLHQPVHVDDLAASLWAAAAAPGAVGQAINVPGPRALRFDEIVAEAGQAVGRRARVVPAPTRVMRSAVALQERLPSPRLKVEQINRLLEDKAFAVDDAAELLGHEPRAFGQGIADEAALMAKAGW